MTNCFYHIRKAFDLTKIVKTIIHVVVIISKWEINLIK